VIFEFSGKITLNDKHFNSVMFDLQLTWCIYNTRSRFNNYWAFIVDWVAIHSRHSKCPPSEPRHAWTHIVTDCHTIESRFTADTQNVLKPEPRHAWKHIITDCHTIESRFTADTQNILHLNQGTLGHTLSWTVTPLPKVRSGTHGNGATGMKYALVKCLNIFSWSWTRWGF
jgi:hypothetical protein